MTNLNEIAVDAQVHLQALVDQVLMYHTDSDVADRLADYLRHQRRLTMAVSTALAQGKQEPAGPRSVLIRAGLLRQGRAARRLYRAARDASTAAVIAERRK